MELDKNPERIEGLFDDITPTYDRLNHLMSMSMPCSSGRLPRPWQAVLYSGDKKDARVRRPFFYLEDGYGTYRL